MQLASYSSKSLSWLFFFGIPKVNLVTKVIFVYVHIAIASLLACTKAAVRKFTLQWNSVWLFAVVFYLFLFHHP